ncbi:MAG TPA: hypothetical protein PLP64_05725 [Pseudothermotoga sp.]|nr:hypothetical protein [Pseudothermotoga sp.]HOK83709.1 hypothetical protein [Pseudothermotoga sp.]HPP69348.1 hypothetical protein [Pseudothermotoga sp.]
MTMKDLGSIKEVLRQNGYEIESEKVIQNGVQLRIKNCGHLRIYWRKDGQTTIDFSQINDLCITHLRNVLDQSECKLLESSMDDLEIQRRVLENLPTDPRMILPAIGSDESGKGDIFGPVVVAAVYIGQAEYAKLNLSQLKDSKLLDDKKILYLSDQIRSLCDYSIAVVEPKDLTRAVNMNRLLEDLHARCISDLARKRKPVIAIYDDFGAKKLKEKLRGLGGLVVLGFVKAEVNAAVAAASIVARAEFLSWIEKASGHYGRKIPLGAGQKAIEFAKSFLKEYGLAEFEKLAKVNFSNVRKLIVSFEGKNLRSS